jgi:Asp-tRNA(Asn)/Glu-tRNA(Gln) amidotransferase A subunit family amidase
MLDDWDKPNLKGLKLGVYWPWFRHADPEVVAACESMLKQFEARGAEICEIVIPNLEMNRVAHTVTIISEMAQAVSCWHAEHHREHGLDVRVTLDLGRSVTSLDYIQAQRVRTRMIAHFKNAFEQVDAILTPTTGIVAPPILKGALPDGESDLSKTADIMRFATAANMTGFPAITFPVGYTQSGLPIGMQAIGRAWEESLLLRIAVNAEEVVERKAPKVFYGIL